MAVAIILYARVSTAEQTIEHQLAHAQAAGFSIAEVVADNGVTGLHSRLVERPEGRRLFDKLRTVKCLWSVGLISGPFTPGQVGMARVVRAAKGRLGGQGWAML